MSPARARKAPALPPEIACLRVIRAPHSKTTPVWFVFDGPTPEDRIAIIAQVHKGATPNFRARRSDQGHYTDHPSLAHAVEFVTRPQED